MKRRTVLIIIAGIGGLFAMSCLACIALAAFMPSSKTPMPAVAAAGSPVAVATQATTTAATKATNTIAATRTSAPTNIPKPTNTPAPTATPRPTSTPAPTATPKPTNTPVPTPKPIALSGRGQTATNAITLPQRASVVRFTHDGTRNFAVWVYMGAKRDLLVNTIGAYEGRRLVISDVPVTFDIEADGGWTLAISPLATGGQPAFSGHGDDVSALFDPPATGPWEIRHDGKSNFAVWLRCAKSSDLVQNEIGPVSGSRVIRSADGPCCWEVEADGNWSLTPR